MKGEEAAVLSAFRRVPDPVALATDPGIDVFVELIGGVELEAPGLDLLEGGDRRHHLRHRGDAQGAFPSGSVNQRVELRLIALSEKRRALAVPERGGMGDERPGA